MPTVPSGRLVTVLRGVGAELEERRVFGMLPHPSVKRVHRMALAINETSVDVVFRCLASTKIADLERSIDFPRRTDLGDQGLKSAIATLGKSVQGSQITEDRVPIRHTSAKWARSEFALARMEV